MDINLITLVGNLVRDPQVKTTQTGKTFARFTVATSREIINSQTGEAKIYTDYNNCVVWGTDAQALNGVTKGQEVIVIGRSTTRSWEQNGEKRFSQEIAADHVSVVGKKAPANWDQFSQAKTPFGKADEEIPF